MNLEMVQKQEQVLATLRYALQNNHDAVDFILELNYVVELVDDLEDGDTRSIEEVKAAFRIALYDIPTNPFYARYSNHLLPLIMSSILAWHDSNILSKGSDHDRNMAWMLKQQVTRIANHCAFLIGGESWARQVGVDIARIYTETLESYLDETKKEA